MCGTWLPGFQFRGRAHGLGGGGGVHSLNGSRPGVPEAERRRLCQAVPRLHICVELLSAGSRQKNLYTLGKLSAPNLTNDPPAPTFDNRIPDVAEIPVITVLAVHFAVAAVAPLLFRKFGRNSFYALAAVPAASFIWLLLQHGAVYSGTARVLTGRLPKSCPGSPGCSSSSPSGWTPWPGSCPCWCWAWVRWCWSTAPGTSRTRTTTSAVSAPSCWPSPGRCSGWSPRMTCSCCSSSGN